MGGGFWSLVELVGTLGMPTVAAALVVVLLWRNARQSEVRDARAAELMRWQAEQAEERERRAERAAGRREEKLLQAITHGLVHGNGNPEEPSLKGIAAGVDALAQRFERLPCVSDEACAIGRD